MLYIVIIALVTQLPSSSYFFNTIQSVIKPDIHPYLNWTFALTYALIAEAAMLVWVIRGKKTVSWMYCVVSILINLTSLLSVRNLNGFYVFGGIIFSVAVPITIALFSEEFSSSSVKAEEREREKKQKKKDRAQREFNNQMEFQKTITEKDKEHTAQLLAAQEKANESIKREYQQRIVELQNTLSGSLVSLEKKQTELMSGISSQLGNTGDKMNEALILQENQSEQKLKEINSSIGSLSSSLQELTLNIQSNKFDPASLPKPVEFNVGNLKKEIATELRNEINSTLTDHRKQLSAEMKKEINNIPPTFDVADKNMLIFKKIRVGENEKVTLSGTPEA